MSQETIIKNQKYDQAIKHCPESAMEIGRRKPYYMNFKEEKKMKKELTKIITAQITLVVKEDDERFPNSIGNREEQAKEVKDFLLDEFGADDVLVEVKDFVREEA